MRRMPRVLPLLILSVLLVPGLMGCGSEEPQTLGDQVEQAAEETGEAMKQAADDVKEAAEDVGEELKEAGEEVEQEAKKLDPSSGG